VQDLRFSYERYSESEFILTQPMLLHMCYYGPKDRSAAFAICITNSDVKVFSRKLQDSNYIQCHFFSYSQT